MSDEASMADRVLAEIRRTPGVAFGELWPSMRDRGDPLRAYHTTGRALQVLRKRGAIKLRGRKWYPAEGGQVK